MKVLVVDDSRMMRNYISRAVQELSSSVNVQVAANAEDALTLARVFLPDVVLSDLNMPGMSGLELLVELRRSGSPARFGLVTSEGLSHETRKAALDAGADFVLPKPLDMQQLRSAVLGSNALHYRTVAATVQQVANDLLKIADSRIGTLIPSIPEQMSGSLVSIDDGCLWVELGLFAEPDSLQTISRLLLGEEDPKRVIPDPEVVDCIGELANVIAGNLKARMARDGIRIGTPVFMKGPDAARAADQVALEMVLGDVSTVLVLKVENR